MLAGFVTAIANYVLYEHGVIHYGSVMEMDFLGGTWGFAVNALTAWLVSLAGEPKSDGELKGLVFWLREPRVPTSQSWVYRPATLAVAVALLTITLNIVFR